MPLTTAAPESARWSPPPLAAALRASLREGVSRADLLADLGAGLTVGIVALPLSLALAIASGAPPAAGLATAIVGGAVCALAGGSRVQVTGPTAAFVVLLAPIAERHGLRGLAVASSLAGLLLLALAAARLGGLVALVPRPVVAGFTAGIGVVLATLQVRDLLGLEIASWPEHLGGKAIAMAKALPTARPGDMAVGALTLVATLAAKRWIRRIPAPLIGLLVGLGAALLLSAWRPELAAATVAGRFGDLPQGLPAPALPWQASELLPGALPAWELARELAPAAVAIALLAALESILCAVVADGMTGRRHDPDGELVGLGLANLIAPIFGGFAATGAVARTATSVRAGARSPFAALLHCAFLLACTLLLAPMLGRLPLAALAALLLVVAWNVADIPHVRHVLRLAPRADALVLLTCFFLTVAFDMVVAVVAGVGLASLLFMKRMAEITGVRLIGEEHDRSGLDIPPNVLLYQVAGPLFFGASGRAMSALSGVRTGTRAVVLDLVGVPALDLTGLVNLESALDRLTADGRVVVIAGLAPEGAAALRRTGRVEPVGAVMLSPDVPAALDRVRELVPVEGGEAFRPNSP